MGENKGKYLNMQTVYLSPTSHIFIIGNNTFIRPNVVPHCQFDAFIEEGVFPQRGISGCARGRRRDGAPRPRSPPPGAPHTPPIGPVRLREGRWVGSV